MVTEFRKTLFKVIHLRSIIGYNGLVFALKKTPLIGKILPDRLYKTTALKVIYWILHIIKESFMLFIGKIAGLSMVYLISLFMEIEYVEHGLANGVSEPVLFGAFSLFFFMIYALCGVLIRMPIYNCPPEKEYLVFMLRMNARKLDNTLFAYDLLKLVIGYLLAAPFAAIAGAPVWATLGIPVLAVFIKLFGAGLQSFVFKLKSKHHKPMHTSAMGIAARLTVAMICAPILLTIIVNGYFIPLWIIFVAAAVLVLLGIWGFVQLNNFDSNLHRRALRDNIIKTEIEHHKQHDNTKQFKKLKAKGTVKGNKTGFEFLNALFVKRHRKLLVVKPIIFTVCTLGILAFIIFAFVSTYHMDFGTDATVQMVINNLINMLLFRGYEDTLMPLELDSGTLFLRYLAQDHMLGIMILMGIADVSFTATQAMYINCDNSLMTFSFFKQREKIMQLFDIRLKQLIKLNFIPAVTCGLCANMLLFATGGQDYPFHYLVNILICVLISVVNSVTWLALYYLFQPFTTSVNVKGGAYIAARTIIAILSVHICWIPCNSLLLTGILIVFTAAYVLLLRKLVRKYAPKTWKVKA